MSTNLSEFMMGSYFLLYFSNPILIQFLYFSNLYMSKILYFSNLAVYQSSRRSRKTGCNTGDFSIS